MSVSVPMVNIRIVRVGVPQWSMPVMMRVRLDAVPFKRVLMLVVVIVAVHVPMREIQMLVFMPV